MKNKPDSNISHSFTQNNPKIKAETIAEALGGRRSGNGWIAKCPAHDDRNPSLSVSEKNGKVLVKCHAGCAQDDVIEALRARGLWPSRRGRAAKTCALPPGIQSKWDDKPYKTHWTYYGADGEVLGFVVRYENDQGKQVIPYFRKKGATWKAKAPTPPRPLYNLNLLAQRREDPVILTEGEKAAEAAAKLFPDRVATTCQGGAKAPAKTDWAPLKGREVLVWPDNDQSGLEFARVVKRLALKAGANAVKILDPAALGMGKKEDAADWPPDRGLPDPLPELEEEDHASAADLRDRPHVYAREGDLAVLVQRGWEVLLAANKPPSIFLHNDVVMRLDASGRIFPITEKALRSHLARVAFFFDLKGPEESKEKVPTAPPKILVESLLHEFNPPLPVLKRIVSHPVFVSDGSLHAVRGYDPATGFFMTWPEGLPLPTAPGNPTREDVRRAVETILDAIDDFPFKADPDRAHTIALMILPFAREMISGPTPIHLIIAPCHGTGKTLLAETCAAPAGETAMACLTEGRDDDEWRKRITSALLQGAEIILIDNVNRRLESGALSSAVTARTWTDRLLGQSKNVSLPVSCAWVVTGNNVLVSSEISRRCVPIRLVSQTEEPWRRPPEGFKHPDLRAFLDRSRGLLASSVMTLVRAWIAAGKPMWQGQPLGSFEAWSRIVGGILEVAGIKGFLDNMTEFYSQSDFEGAFMRPFVFAWWSAFKANEVGVADLFELAEREEIGLPLGDGSERSRKIRLGKLLSKYRDRVFGRFVILPGPVVKRAQTWRLSPIMETVRGQGEYGECFPSQVASTNREGECLAPDPQHSPQHSPAQNRMESRFGECGEKSECFPGSAQRGGEKIVSYDVYKKDPENIHPYAQHSPNQATMRVRGGECWGECGECGDHDTPQDNEVVEVFDFGEETE